MSALGDIGEVPREELDDPATLAWSLFEEHRARLQRQCARMLRSADDAEDAVQQTFLHALQALQAGTRPRVEAAWLSRIAHNVCIERLRAAGRRSRLETPTSPDAFETVAAGHGEDERPDLAAALAAIEPRQREALLLREWRGLSYREIASVLQLSQSAVEALIHRARRALARALEEGRSLRSLLGLGNLAGALRTLLPGGAAKTAGLAAGCCLAVVAAPRVEHAVGGGDSGPSHAPRAAVADHTAAAPLPSAAVAPPRQETNPVPREARARVRPTRATATTPPPPAATAATETAGAAAPAPPETPTSDPGGATTAPPHHTPTPPTTAPAADRAATTADPAAEPGSNPAPEDTQPIVAIQAGTSETGVSANVAAGEGGASVDASVDVAGTTAVSVDAAVGPGGAQANVTAAGGAVAAGATADAGGVSVSASVPAAGVEATVTVTVPLPALPPLPPLPALPGLLAPRSR
jgi:RNA polymerase sigma-70 factor (ECF subfamily)